ncbi:hypothetical protein [Frigoriglobus tundricola]|uniref:Uncharacterized protein n=1 Tax=Frigoriglobus tundricola TaxID=2774151 RepID=A0A6M5Z1T5_9BACT|nr:hypothetical protein [Frigoriglobus tundricola]QJX00340.1 hypothetical protein FTUN_7966 [Frigoriglobus tundricola]
MKRRTLAFLVVMLLAWGGYQLWADQQKRPVDPNQPLSRRQLEGTLRQKYELETVSLEEAAPGRFTGTGRSRQGKTYRFDITQGEKTREVVAKWDEPNAPGGVGESHWGMRW